MAKEKRVKMYNKGTRGWDFNDNGKTVHCDPGKSIELNESQAKKFVKNYPHDFLAGEPVQKSNDSKKLKAEVAKLEKTVADYEKRVAEMTDEIAVFEEKVMDLETALTGQTEADLNSRE